MLLLLLSGCVVLMQLLLLSCCESSILSTAPLKAALLDTHGVPMSPWATRGCVFKTCAMATIQPPHHHHITTTHMYAISDDLMVARQEVAHGHISDETGR